MKLVVWLMFTLTAITARAESISRPDVAAVVAPTGSATAKPQPTWLDGGGQAADGSVTEQAVARLLKPILSDTATAPLVARALELSGKASLSGILKVCAWNWGKDNWTQGQTNSGYVTQTALPRASYMTAARKAERKAYYKKVIQEFVAEHPDSTYFVRANSVGYTMMTASKSESICLAPNLTLKTAQSVLVHELVHFNYPGGSNRIEVQGLRDAEEYARFRFTSAGGEADAFRAGFSAQARWAGTPNVLPLEVRKLFDAKGSYLGQTAPLLDADGKLLGRVEDPLLEKYVLTTLGYGKSFATAYLGVLEYFKSIFERLVVRVNEQLEWVNGNSEIQEQIAVQVTELQAAISEIEVKHTLASGVTP